VAGKSTRTVEVILPYHSVARATFFQISRCFRPRRNDESQEFFSRRKSLTSTHAPPATELSLPVVGVRMSLGNVVHAWGFPSIITTLEDKIMAMSSKPRIVYGQALGALEETIQRAIAYRAYELFEARGGDHGHDLEDWFRAEKELVKPGNIQTMDSGGQIKVHASVPGFTGDEIQIGIAPTRLIIWGQAPRPGTLAGGGIVQMLGEIDLPCPIDPKSSRAEIVDGVLNFQADKANPASNAA